MLFKQASARFRIGLSAGFEAAETLERLRRPDMYEKKIPENLECGLSVALKVVGGKWKARIIDCIHKGIKRPSSLHKAIEGTSARLMRMQLKELEDHGIVKKRIISALPIKVEYSLTRLGITVLPVLEVMDEWGDRHRSRILGNNP